jgi:IstB-like ATP binding protein
MTMTRGAGFAGDSALPASRSEWGDGLVLSMIVTSNKPFSAWGEIFGDDMAATAMIDRLLHHSEILSLKGDSYRLRGKDLDARIATKHTEIG